VTYLKLGGTPEGVAEELAQEVMVVVWREAASFDRSRGAVATWIFTIARNLRIDRYRREGGKHRGVDQALDLDEQIVDPAALPEDHFSVIQRESRVREALKKLSPKQAHLLHLSFFAESPHSDIARDLCVPLGTAKSQIRSALLSMRRLLEGSGP
jgi:RNA polymerase sigma-70 factor (ECF subfamily)